MLQRVTQRRSNWVLSCAVVLAWLVLLQACRKTEDSATATTVRHPAGKDVGAPRERDGMESNPGDAEIRVATADEDGLVALPADFPVDVFLPAQRTVNSTMDMGGMKMVNITTPAVPTSVAADIERAMQAHGWKREMAMQADGSSTLIYAKDRRQAVYQMLKAEGGGTRVAVRAGGD